ncbi:MAG: hypothetical protein V1897_19700 [Pseudomonadota bacterium]
MTKITYQIAFDPGITGVGYSIWQNTKWIRAGTIKPKHGAYLTKLTDLREKLTQLYFELLIEPESSIERVIIEDWEKFIPRHRIATMLKCSEGRGVIVSVSSGFCKDISLVNKHQAPKKEAQVLARKDGVKGSNHALDAYYLGMLGGFGLGNQI